MDPACLKINFPTKMFKRVCAMSLKRQKYPRDGGAPARISAWLFLGLRRTPIAEFAKSISHLPAIVLKSEDSPGIHCVFIVSSDSNPKKYKWERTRRKVQDSVRNQTNLQERKQKKRNRRNCYCPNAAAEMVDEHDTLRRGPISAIKPAPTSCFLAEDPSYPKPQHIKDIEKDLDEHSPCSTHNESIDDTIYPEGGLEAWLVTFGAWCAMFSALGLMNTIGTIQAYVSTHQLKRYSESEVSWIFSVYVFLVFFCGLQIGPIFDATGPRLLILSGSVLLVLSMMLLGLCTAYWHFMVIFGIIGGLGCSLLFTPAIASISHFFMERRSAATGLACTGGACGGIAFPLALRSMLPRLGFAWSTRILGFVYLFFVILANILIRSRLPPKRKPDLKSVLPDFRIFKDGTGAFALVTAGTFFMEFGLFVPVAYLTSYGFANGIDNALSYQLISIFNAGSFFGRWLPGLAADKFGRFNAMIAMLLLCMVTTFALWLPAAYSTRTVSLVVAYSVIFGFASGSNISLTPTCVGELCDTREYGRYYATCYTVVSVGTLTGIPIAGSLIDAAGGLYWGLIVFTGLCYVAALACFVWVRVAKVGWKLTAMY